MDYKIESEYLKWLGDRNQRKAGNYWYQLYTEGTKEEVQKVHEQIKNSYYFLSAIETFTGSDGSKREVHLLYVRNKPLQLNL